MEYVEWMRYNKTYQDKTMHGTHSSSSDRNNRKGVAGVERIVQSWEVYFFFGSWWCTANVTC